MAWKVVPLPLDLPEVELSSKGRQPALGSPAPGRPSLARREIVGGCDDQTECPAAEEQATSSDKMLPEFGNLSSQV